MSYIHETQIVLCIYLFSLAHGTCFKAILVVLLSYYMVDARIIKTNDRLTLSCCLTLGKGLLQKDIKLRFLYIVSQISLEYLLDSAFRLL